MYLGDIDFLAAEQLLLEPRFLLAAALGAVIGLEREIAGKDPSLRTFALVSLGSCIFAVLAIISTEGIPNADPSRISAQVVAGIGFIGAGTIFRSKRGVSGLTTAALMWTTAGIGMLVGYGHTQLAVSGTLTALLITLTLRLVHQLLRLIRVSRTGDEDEAEIGGKRL